MRRRSQRSAACLAARAQSVFLRLLTESAKEAKADESAAGTDSTDSRRKAGARGVGAEVNEYVIAVTVVDVRAGGAGAGAGAGAAAHGSARARATGSGCRESAGREAANIVPWNTLLIITKERMEMAGGTRTTSLVWFWISLRILGNIASVQFTPKVIMPIIFGKFDT